MDLVALGQWHAPISDKAQVAVAVVHMRQRFGPHRLDHVDLGRQAVLCRFAADLQVARPDAQRDLGAG